MVSNIMLIICFAIVLLIIYKIINNIFTSAKRKKTKNKYANSHSIEDRDYYSEIIKETRKHL